ncbi:hypothetical protein DEO72_LG5g561 [Vigna unguiculata]|uniref:Uncharacterized protein n=1 Tax=Vigna unguiculata TaxID=3917 RepID=A0A4D6L2N8_VIGUN|nr:hypothetical protein DEO72_LG2g3075 [Vigna unguiculata]QCD92496.1 hypothetical protein DEO72_LG5g561 [Vigna unguiculata]
MSPRLQSGSDKGKKKTKPRRQLPRYIIRVRPFRHHHLLRYTPPTSTPPTSTPHPIVVPAPPTSTPHPIVVIAPTTSTPQPSHQGPSPVVVRSEQGSCADASEHNDDADKEDVIRTPCWVDVVGEKNKGRLYGTGELGKGFTYGRGIHKQQPSSSSNAKEVVNRLTQRLEERDQAYENLSSILEAAIFGPHFFAPTKFSRTFTYNPFFPTSLNIATHKVRKQSLVPSTLHIATHKTSK